MGGINITQNLIFETVFLTEPKCSDLNCVTTEDGCDICDEKLRNDPAHKGRVLGWRNKKCICKYMLDISKINQVINFQW